MPLAPSPRGEIKGPRGEEGQLHSSRQAGWQGAAVPAPGSSPVCPGGAERQVVLDIPWQGPVSLPPLSRAAIKLCGCSWLERTMEDLKSMWQKLQASRGKLLVFWTVCGGGGGSGEHLNLGSRATAKSDKREKHPGEQREATIRSVGTSGSRWAGGVRRDHRCGSQGRRQIWETKDEQMEKRKEMEKRWPRGTGKPLDLPGAVVSRLNQSNPLSWSLRVLLVRVLECSREGG